MRTTIIGKKPAARKKTLFPLLGVALLMTCLFAGVAQAADGGTVLDDTSGIMQRGASPFNACASGGDPNQAIPVVLESHDTECTYHTVACYDRDHKLLGDVGSGCSWVPFKCTDGFDNMMKHCKGKFGEIVWDAESVTPCYWDSG